MTLSLHNLRIGAFAIKAELREWTRRKRTDKVALLEESFSAYLQELKWLKEGAVIVLSNDMRRAVARGQPVTVAGIQLLPAEGSQI